jgi:hypothetical protein
MRAALYARVSAERQERFQTIDSQLAALRDWAATGGHEISDDFVFRDEGYTMRAIDSSLPDQNGQSRIVPLHWSWNQAEADQGRCYGTKPT